MQHSSRSLASLDAHPAHYKELILKATEGSGSPRKQTRRSAVIRTQILGINFPRPAIERPARGHNASPFCLAVLLGLRVKWSYGDRPNNRPNHLNVFSPSVQCRFFTCPTSFFPFFCLALLAAYSLACPCNPVPFLRLGRVGRRFLWIHVAAAATQPLRGGRSPSNICGVIWMRSVRKASLFLSLLEWTTTTRRNKNKSFTITQKKRKAPAPWFQAFLLWTLRPLFERGISSS